MCGHHQLHQFVFWPKVFQSDRHSFCLICLLSPADIDTLQVCSSVTQNSVCGNLYKCQLIRLLNFHTRWHHRYALECYESCIGCWSKHTANNWSTKLWNKELTCELRAYELLSSLRHWMCAVPHTASFGDRTFEACVRACVCAGVETCLFFGLLQSQHKRIVIAVSSVISCCTSCDADELLSTFSGSSRVALDAGGGCSLEATGHGRVVSVA